MGYSFKTGKEEEDRSRDWNCPACGERNFMKRFECFKCRTQKPLTGFSDSAPVAPVPMQRRNVSPHAGSRAWRDTIKAEMGAAARSRSRSKGKKKKKKNKKKKKKKKSSSSSSSSAVQVEDGASNEAASSNSGSGNAEIEKAKVEALAQLQALREVEPKEARLAQFRALLRQWHPDKNPDKIEVATTVFQFLQKGKPLIAL